MEQVNTGLEEAALTTARALQEIAGHWDAVYEAVRREEEPPMKESPRRSHAGEESRRGRPGRALPVTKPCCRE